MCFRNKSRLLDDPIALLLWYFPTLVASLQEARFLEQVLLPTAPASPDRSCTGWQHCMKQ